MAPLSKDPARLNNGVILLKNQLWKGHTVVYQSRAWNSFYVGHGLKSDCRRFYPAVPQPVLTEQKDLQEFPEPNFPPDPPAEDKPPAEEAPPQDE
jgi:hypothetical protein